MATSVVILSIELRLPTQATTLNVPLVLPPNSQLFRDTPLSARPQRHLRDRVSRRALSGRHDGQCENERNTRNENCVFSSFEALRGPSCGTNSGL